MILVAVLALALFAYAAGRAYAALVAPRLRRSEHLEQIDSYGYAERSRGHAAKGWQARDAFDSLAGRIGDTVARRLRSLREDDLQRDLVAAGFFGIGARRFLGYRVVLTLALPLLLIWIFGLLGASGDVLVLLAAAGLGVGWLGPSFVVHRRARLRLQVIDDALPELIDLLVVTLEAGISFTAALRMSAERLQGPLGEEIRLTIQEQTLGLSTLDALGNWNERCDTPAVRSFVRAMVQGESLGVSIGQILRNQATEMRARRRFLIEEKAQKAPVKLLFPLVLLIFPAMFIIILASGAVHDLREAPLQTGSATRDAAPDAVEDGRAVHVDPFEARVVDGPLACRGACFDQHEPHM